jgi:hypothetical protein
MKPTYALILSATLIAGLAGLAAAAPAATDARQNTPAPALAVGEYCVEKERVTVEGITVYPGGRYCVPAP